jgi:hypothetical protein
MKKVLLNCGYEVKDKKTFYIMKSICNTIVIIVVGMFRNFAYFYNKNDDVRQLERSK